MKEELPRIRTLVVEDEPLARQLLLTMLRAQPQLEIAGDTGDGPEAVTLIAELRPELLFIDVRLPGLDAFEVLARVPAHDMPFVVFVSAYDQYAIQAFEVHALDYLLKPFDRKRLERTVGHAVESVRRRDRHDNMKRLVQLLAAAPAPPPRPRRLAVRTEHSTIFIDVAAIDWIEAAGKHVRVHVGDTCYVMRRLIRKLEESLDGRLFIRVSRSAMVNLDRVAEIRTCVRGEYLLVLANGTRVTTTRAYREHVERLLR